MGKRVNDIRVERRAAGLCACGNPPIADMASCESCRGRDKARYPGRRQSIIAAHRKRLFGVSQEIYDQMLRDQGGRCAICKGKCSSGMSLAVDHCHTTGRARGLLCSNCNNGLGRFKDDTKLLRSASEYLNDSTSKRRTT